MLEERLRKEMQKKTEEIEEVCGQEVYKVVKKINNETFISAVNNNLLDWNWNRIPCLIYKINRETIAPRFSKGIFCFEQKDDAIRFYNKFSQLNDLVILKVRGYGKASKVSKLDSNTLYPKYLYCSSFSGPSNTITFRSIRPIEEIK